MIVETTEHKKRPFYLKRIICMKRTASAFPDMKVASFK